MQGQWRSLRPRTQVQALVVIMATLIFFWSHAPLTCGAASTIHPEIEAIIDEGGGRLSSCGAAMLQGLRLYQEDRILCMSDIVLPPFGGMPETKISLFAVFDGHGGDEASELASKNLHRRFLHHLYASVVPSFVVTSLPNQSPKLPTVETDSSTHDKSCEVKLVEENQSSTLQESDTARKIPTANTNKTMTAIDLFEHSALGNMLKEALSRAISDIESTFLSDAMQTGLQAGSTACVVLQVGSHLLVASLGDSKALLCPATTCSPPPPPPPPDSTPSELLGKRQSKILERRLKRLKEKSPGVNVCSDGPVVLELTRDHRPDREDERLRIEAAGGFVESYGGLPRVNGQLAVSRSIGDLAFKKYGVTADPEWTGWLKVGKNDSHLIIASDGVFEKMTTQEVCGVVSATKSGIDISAALGLVSPARERPIALLPSRQRAKESQQVKEIQPSRALMAIPMSNIGLAPSQLPGSTPKEQKMYVGASNGRGQSGPDLFDLTTLNVQESSFGTHDNYQITVDSHGDNWRSLPGRVGSGSEIVPLGREVPARVLAKAVVDAAFNSGSKDNLAAIVITLHPGAKDASDKSLQETEKKAASTHKMTEAQQINSPSLYGRPGSTNDEQYSKKIELLSSGILVKGYGDGDCYELIETVVGSSIVPWHPVVEYDFTEESSEAGKPIVERLPASAAHAGVVGGKLEVYREHLICTPRFVVERGHKEVCIPPEGLSRFLSLIGSVPLDKQQMLPKHWDAGGRSQDLKFVSPYSVHHHRYMLKKNFARGAFGEIWLAVKRPCLKVETETGDRFFMDSGPKENRFQESRDTGDIGWRDEGPSSSGDTFILKRIMVEKGGNTYLSGLREKHFGQLFLNESLNAQVQKNHQHIFSTSSTLAGSYLKAYFKSMSVLGFYRVGNMSSPMEGNRAGLAHIARYVESFEVAGKEEFWLVFHNEGKSLSSLLYTAGINPQDGKNAEGFKIVQPSSWWRWLKTTNEGREEMRSILRQLFLAVKACHDRNITHRDIKPENMVVSTDRNHGSEWPSNLTMRIIDFGSAIDRYTLNHLYSSSGPSQGEQTKEYAPPEATLGSHWLHFHTDEAHVYDMWSVGIVMLELVLGTPHVFQISARTRVLLDRQLDGMEESARETIYLLRAYLEMCILLPGTPPQHHHHHRSDTVDQAEEVRLAAWKCSEESVAQQIRQRDPLGIGMPDVWALRLLRKLLQWYPEDRISAAEALQHPYFHLSLQG